MYICSISGIQPESASTDTWVPSARIRHPDKSKGPKNARVQSEGRGGNHALQQNMSIAVKSFSSYCFLHTEVTEQRKYAEMKVDAEKNVNKYFRAWKRRTNPRCLSR